jgi:membrane associated rhomboid family serine protease
MVLPLRDIQPRQTFPVVTVGLIAINTLIFFYELSLGHQLQRFLLENAFVPSRFFEPGHWVADGRSILLSMFLHGGWAHLLGNMLYLWIFGDNVEERLGRGRYVLFYLFCGWFATMAHAFSNKLSVVPSIGASGAIAGVLGAYLVMFPHARVLTVIPLGFFIRIAELPALFVLGFWFVLQLFSGTLSLGAQSAQSAGVAWFAHIGGFVAGMVVGRMARRRDPGRRTRED